MTDILSVVATALQADQTRLDQASLNAANASTPGYRRGTVVAVAFDQAFSSAAQSAGFEPGTAGASAVRHPSWVAAKPVLQRATDFTHGALMQTGRALDIAVEGEGFVSLTDGQRTWLTRTASLMVSSSGELVGPRGLRIVSDQGDLRPGSDQGLSIQGNGQLLRGDQVLGQIRVVRPVDAAQLVSQDGVLFEVGEQVLESANDRGVLRAGFLEGSNTNHLKEMLGVMENVRHFESLIRLAQGYDEVLGRAIQKLGEV